MRKPSQPEYPELQTAEQFLNAMLEACVVGHHTRNEPMIVALELWKWVGKKVEITSDMPEYLHKAYVAGWNDPDYPKQNVGGMLLTEIYFDVVNHETHAYAMGDEGWSLLVTNQNFSIKELTD